MVPTLTNKFQKEAFFKGLMGNRPPDTDTLKSWCLTKRHVVDISNYNVCDIVKGRRFPKLNFKDPEQLNEYYKYMRRRGVSWYYRLKDRFDGLPRATNLIRVEMFDIFRMYKYIADLGLDNYGGHDVTKFKCYKNKDNSKIVDSSTDSSTDLDSDQIECNMERADEIMESPAEEAEIIEPSAEAVAKMESGAVAASDSPDSDEIERNMEELFTLSQDLDLERAVGFQIIEPDTDTPSLSEQLASQASHMHSDDNQVSSTQN